MSNTIDVTGNSISDILSDIAKYIASLATIFVSTLILHEYVYFSMIGQEFMLMYSLADFAKVATNWIPWTIALGFFGFLINFYDLNARFRAVETHGASALEAWRKPDRLMIYLTNALFLIIFLSIPFIRWDLISMLQIPAITGISWLIGTQISAGRLPITRRPAEGIMLYLFIGWLLVSSVFGGLTEGIKDVKKTAPVYNFALRDKDIEAILLRSIDKGVLYRAPDSKKVILSPWSEIRQIESKEIIFSEKTLWQNIRDVFK